jgi:transaldolase
MEIFIDSASTKEIQKWLGLGVIDGVTTNPSIMLKDKVYDAERGAKEIAALVHPLPLSVEVTTNDIDEMYLQAQTFASWAPNIVIKIPHINQDGVPCYGVIKQLEGQGIRVNATAALSIGQVILAAKAGATYISVFAGRVTDEGGNATEVIRNSANWLEHWNYKSKLVVGSIRSVGDVLSAVLAGAHVVTIPPQFLEKMADHKNTRATVAQFIEDARKSAALMQQKKAIESLT